MSKKKHYSDEFKREAIRLQESSGKTVAEVERELGLIHYRYMRPTPLI